MRFKLGLLKILNDLKDVARIIETGIFFDFDFDLEPGDLELK
jgi:hypothetical protein